MMMEATMVKQLAAGCDDRIMVYQNCGEIVTCQRKSCGAKIRRGDTCRAIKGAVLS